MKWQDRKNSIIAAYIIASNPEATGSAGAGTGGYIDPLDDVRDIFTKRGMMNNQRDGMINAHNLTSMEDLIISGLMMPNHLSRFVIKPHEQWPQNVTCPHRASYRDYYTDINTREKGN